MSKQASGQDSMIMKQSKKKKKKKKEGKKFIFCP